tara:strand:+ start:95 stop:997 length:903 start_codon:yes stop_codon:yes gene_type:complete
MSDENTEFIEFKNKFTSRIQNNLLETFNAYGEDSCDLLEPMKYSSLNGSKFIRPLLVYAAGSTLNIDSKLLDQPALAIELIHTYTLIHDDLPCMDDDDIRRGAPSCHIAFNESSAVLAGDALQSLAFEILSNKKYEQISHETYLNWTNYLSKSIGILGVAGGQYLDLSINDKSVELNELEKIYSLKTGNLIAPCIMLPFMLDNNCNASFEKLRIFGLLLGVSFQIKDDLLGYTSSSEILGKTKNKDELRNQPNYVSLLGVDKTIKKLKENKKLTNKILEDLGFKNSILFEISNYIFNREF